MEGKQFGGFMKVSEVQYEDAALKILINHYNNYKNYLESKGMKAIGEMEISRNILPNSIGWKQNFISR